MDVLDRATSEEEKAKFIEKLFSYAETPIKEWLSEYLNKPAEEVFDDFVDDGKTLGFESDGKFYHGYLITAEPNKGPFVDKNLLEIEQVKKACSMLYDSVLTVLKPVALQVEELKDIWLSFDNDKLAFKPVLLNTLKYKKYSAIQKYQNLSYRLQELQNIDPESLNAIDRTALNEDLRSTKVSLDHEHKTIDEISNEEIQRLDDEYEDLNEQRQNANWLYLVIDDNLDQAELIDESLKRLPEFGIKYHDGEPFSEIIKKEYNLND